MTVRMASALVDNVVKMDFREAFTNQVLDAGASNPGFAYSFTFLALLLVVLAIDVNIIYWLWNHVIVNVITIAKPIKSFWVAAGVLIFLLIVHS
jgi:hypothetical protein